MSSTQQLEEADQKPWIERWLEQDFSWNGLANKDAWNSSVGNLQEFIRKYGSVHHTDEQLIVSSEILECGEYGRFHILFIPPEWVGKDKVLLINEDEIFAKQAAAWKVIRSTDKR